MDFCGLGLKEINTKLGHRRSEHFFYVDSTQFSICTEATYKQLAETLGFASQDWFMPYSEIAAVDQRFRPCFNLEGQTL